MGWDKGIAWDGVTRLLAKAHAWTGKQSFGADIQVTDQIDITDGTDLHTIKAVQETGLGGRLTIGVDATTRALILCDVGDIDTDLGLSAASHPSLFIFSSAAGSYAQYIYDQIFRVGEFGIRPSAKFYAQVRNNLASGNFHEFTSSGGANATDSNGEQSWVYIEPKINQSGTGAANALKIDMTLTGEGDGSTGSGNNLLLLQVSSVDKFRINNTGVLFTSIDEITSTGEGVAASVATAKTLVTTNGDSDEDNVTLADGATGQVKTIICEVSGNAADSFKITPANMVGGTQITFAADCEGKGCILEWSASGWIVSANNGGTIS